MKKITILILSMLVVLGGLAGCSSNSVEESNSDETIVLKFNTNIKSEDANGSAAQKAFKEELEKITEGRVQVEYYYGLTLANTAESVVGGLQTGTFEMGDWPVGSFAEYSKAFMPLDVPYLIANTDVAHEIMRGEVGQMMSDKFAEETGIRVLAYTDLGFRHITNSKNSIKTIEDLKGLKIRTQNNPLHLEGFKALGAAPTPIGFSELFTSLQQGVVDGQENPITNIYNFKFYEIQDYLSLTRHLYTVAGIVISDEYYQSLPEETQKAIDQAAVAAREASIVELQENEAKWLEEMSSKTEINELSDKEVEAFQSVLKNKWDEMAEVIGVEYFNSIKDKVLKLQNNQ